MQGSSKSVRNVALDGFDVVLAAAGKDALSLGAQLFAAVDALDASASLRRVLTDPAAEAPAKVAVVRQLFGSFDVRVQDVLSDLVSQRWSRERELANTVELAATNAVLAAAENGKSLDTVEEELFRVERTIAADRDLSMALNNSSAPAENRGELLAAVFRGKVSDITYALLERAVKTPRGRKVHTALESHVDLAAKRRGRSVVKVVSAVELSAKQRDRLQSILANAYGRDMHLNVTLDPAVVGGIRVQVGSEVVDGTILARLDEARRRLVS